MKKLILPFFLVILSSSIAAQENYATNPHTPYPPACATGVYAMVLGCDTQRSTNQNARHIGTKFLNLATSW